MPNWCQNKLQISCTQAQLELLKSKLFSQNENGEDYLDFEQLLPMPTSLNISSGCRGERAMRLLQVSQTKRVTRPFLKRYFFYANIEALYAKAKHHRWNVGEFCLWLQNNPKEQDKLVISFSLAQQCLSNLARYGYKDWYDWSIANWGCKWNACPDNCIVTFGANSTIECLFDTPWGPPEAWFKALCGAFPDVDLTLSYFEPGMWFAGEYISNNDGTYYTIEIESWEIKCFAEDVFNEEFYDDETEQE